jgi:hypothetical protein
MPWRYATNTARQMALPEHMKVCERMPNGCKQPLDPSLHGAKARCPNLQLWNQQPAKLTGLGSNRTTRNDVHMWHAHWYWTLGGNPHCAPQPCETADIRSWCNMLHTYAVVAPSTKSPARTRASCGGACNMPSWSLTKRRCGMQQSNHLEERE